MGMVEGVGLLRGGDLGGGGEAGAQLVVVVAVTLSMVTTTLKSLASSVPVVDWLVATPVVRSSAWSPTSVTWPLKMRAGQGIDGDVGGLAQLDVDDVGLVDLDLGGDDGHVGEGHQGRAFGVLDADDHGLALADGDVGDEAVEGGAARWSCRGRRSWRAGWRRPG